MMEYTFSDIFNRLIGQFQHLKSILFFLQDFLCVHIAEKPIQAMKVAKETTLIIYFDKK
jgi:hypothetical protein